MMRFGNCKAVYRSYPAASPADKVSSADFNAKGNTAFQAKNFSEAIEHYTSAINIDGANHMYYHNRSFAYSLKGDNLIALKDANSCIGLKPKFAKGYLRKGAALHELKRYNDSISAYEAGLVECPGDKEILSGLDSVKKQKERVERESVEKETAERERVERERLKKERAEGERVEREKVEKETAERERVERERLKKETVARKRLEQKLEEQRLKLEKLEKERTERERAADKEKETAESFNNDDEKQKMVSIDEPSMCAISFQQLRDVNEVAMKMFSNDFESKTMRDINEEIIIPICQETGKPYALAKNPLGLKTDVFISHNWDEPFGEFVNSITDAFRTKYNKPTVWICAFSLLQGSKAAIEAQLEMPLAQSPFVRALRSADIFLVVRNSRTDLYSRIWCICEVMYAKELNFIPNKTQITGPDGFSTTNVSCLDAKSFSPEDKEKIIRELLAKKGSRAEVDKYIDEFRDFITVGCDAVDVQISNEKNETLEGFLGEKVFSAMKTELDDIGVGEVEDLKELETEDFNKLAAKLKKVQAKKFLRKMSEFIDRD